MLKKEKLKHVLKPKTLNNLWSQFLADKSCMEHVAMVWAIDPNLVLDEIPYVQRVNMWGQNFIRTFGKAMSEINYLE